MSIILGVFGYESRPKYGICTVCGRRDILHDRKHDVCYYCFMGLKIVPVGENKPPVKPKTNGPGKIDIRV